MVVRVRTVALFLVRTHPQVPCDTSHCTRCPTQEDLNFGCETGLLGLMRRTPRQLSLLFVARRGALQCAAEGEPPSPAGASLAAGLGGLVWTLVPTQAPPASTQRVVVVFEVVAIDADQRQGLAHAHADFVVEHDVGQFVAVE